MASGNTVDYHHIYEVCGNDEGFVLSLLTVITKGLAEYPKKMELARQENKMEEVREVAHKYKSSVAYLYHQELDQTLDDIETSEEKGLAPKKIAELIDHALDLSVLIKQDVDQKIVEIR